MKTLVKLTTLLFLLVITAYFSGPKPNAPEMNTELPTQSLTTDNIENFITRNDADLPVKLDNESRIIWAQENKKEPTPYSLLYLHGFSASWYEGYPAHEQFAKTFGCNLYLPRLGSHGLKGKDALMEMIPDAHWESAKEALMVARSLGKKVIIMSTSNGGTLALKLAALFPDYIHGLILYSPNIKINNTGASLLSGPWGLQLGRLSNGGEYRVKNDDPDSKTCQYWNCTYPMEATVYLQQLLDVTMTPETFNKVTVPVFLGYYYKDEENQDKTVKVSAMREMYHQLGTPLDNKRDIAFPEAGNHVIASELTSGAIEDVIAKTIQFGVDVLKLTPKS